MKYRWGIFRKEGKGVPTGHDADDETRERDETKLQIFDCMVSRGEDVVFIYKLVSNYLRCLEAVVPNMRSV